MAKGDIVLITFPFTNLSGSKLRPAVVLIESNFDLTVCFVTTQLGWLEQTDIMLFPDEINGIKKQSLLRTNKIATLDKELVKGILGKLTLDKIAELDDKLKILFQLS